MGCAHAENDQTDPVFGATMNDRSHLPNPSNLPFAEGLFAAYTQDPSSVPPDWRVYFDSLVRSTGQGPGVLPEPHFQPGSVFNPQNRDCQSCANFLQAEMAVRQLRVDQMVRAFRVRGHLAAQLDPLGLPRPLVPELDPEFYGLTAADLELTCAPETLSGAPETRTLRDVLQRLRDTYCRSIGVQFMHIDALPPKLWLQDRMEGTANRLALSRDEQIRVLTKLTDAVIFEEFIHRKYIGAKRFSLEGAESLIPLLDEAVERASLQGMDEVVIGMAHRGRINVLANIVGKHPRQIFHEFDDSETLASGSGGDVKYHLGHSYERPVADGKTIHLTLCFNPSHLEAVNPVAMGRLRAKQDRFGDEAHRRGMTLLIHGDAAFAGQGIVQETLNMSELPAFSTGGTLHVVVNNQLGFTTDPGQSRSSLYATDVAKMLQIPIFHVNGEDPEAVAQVIRLAMDFRREFKRDVVVDMYCYRRYGHNEGDEPEFTQPLMYQAIKQRKSVREGYLDHLLGLGGVTREEAEGLARSRRQHLEAELSAARQPDYHSPLDLPRGTWEGYIGGPDRNVPEPETGIPRERLSTVLEALTRLPENFQAHPKIERWLAGRREMAAGARPLDWSAAEALALATLALEGHPVRLTGQDTERGTFSHRHAVLHDPRNGKTFTPLQHLGEAQARVDIFNSSLSEAGVLGFEYGYSLECPEALVGWEAQFGDFSNSAQVIIDQFISSAEDKWRRLSGLVLLLPHGFEGQGPEHSSARLERFMALAAEDNIQIANPTTPAQLFHLLRRQVLRPWRKPLVVMTPKSLLRHPQVVSRLEDLERGRFCRLLPDATGVSGSQVRRVLLCSGKIYFDLAKAREKDGRHDVAIVRLEQLYPLQEDDLAAVLEPYSAATPVVYVQEEPENMGAWRTLRVRFGDRLLGQWPFLGISREASASPASGSARAHQAEQQEIVRRAFSPEFGRKEG